MPKQPALLALALTAAASGAHAADLRLYPTFGEVRQNVTLAATPGGVSAQELTFSRASWSWIQPASLSWTGTPLTRVRTLPGEGWLASQEGQPVTLLRAGQAPLRGVLVRAADLLVKLDSGEYLNAQSTELAFPQLPPRDWSGGDVKLRLEGQSDQGGTLNYRTLALSWNPRYGLQAAGSQARLSALADIRNRSQDTFNFGKVDLYAGEVRMAQQYGADSGALQAQAASTPLPVPVMPGGAASGTAAGIASLGEVRGLQRYALAGPLNLLPGETLTLPFLKPKLLKFTRYEQITAYFQPQESAGSANRHYKFTPDVSMPAGTVDVREDGALVGSVPLPAAQAGRGIDLDLGRDPELRYTRSVQRLSQEKDAAGKVTSTTYQVTYALTSTKALPVRVQVREQLYARSVVVDGGQPQGQQVSISRAADVAAGGQGRVSFKLKVFN